MKYCRSRIYSVRLKIGNTLIYKKNIDRQILVMYENIKAKISKNKIKFTNTKGNNFMKHLSFNYNQSHHP